MLTSVPWYSVSSCFYSSLSNSSLKGDEASLGDLLLSDSFLSPFAIFGLGTFLANWMAFSRAEGSGAFLPAFLCLDGDLLERTKLFEKWLILSLAPGSDSSY